MRNLDLCGLRARLLRGGVAPKHVNRTIRELRHHFTDLEQKALSEGLSQQEAAAQAVVQIGDPNLLIEEALARPELKTWAYRWPWLVYGVLPILTPIALTLLLGVLTIVVVDSDFVSSRAEARPVPAWIAGSLHSMRVSVMYVLPVLLCAGWARFATRRNAPLLGPAVAILLIAIVGCGVNLYVDLPTEVGVMGQVGGGWGYFGGLWDRNLIRLAVTVATVLGPYVLWRDRLKHIEPV